MAVFIILGKKMEGSVRVQSLLKSPMLTGFSFMYKGKDWKVKHWSYGRETIVTPKRLEFNCFGETEMGRKIVYRKGKQIICNGFLFPVDPWSPNIDSQSIASQLFAFSLFPYLVFLYFITKSKTAPRLTLFGFYFLLAFVGATSKLFDCLHLNYDLLLGLKLMLIDNAEPIFFTDECCNFCKLFLKIKFGKLIK